ncbi:uncharacterized protein [Montipora foliosa]|uniref:uncharacterized protein n=1 Tax=Montipora foliosa TaxID=591990 RepID=UPI0035F121FA
MDNTRKSACQMTASFQLSPNTQASYGRLNGKRGIGWWTKTANNTNDWLQFKCSTITTHKLPVAISARYVRFVPTKQYNWNCLRMEINGK